MDSPQQISPPEPINDGGPAFPTYPTHTPGMTLRDWFAGRALASASNPIPRSAYQFIRWFFGYSFIGSQINHKDNARCAYELADAMLAAREAK